MRCAVGAAGGASASTSSAYVPTSRSRGTRRRWQPAAPSAHRRHPLDVTMRGEGLRPTWSARGGHAIDVDRTRGSGIAPSPRHSHGVASPGSAAVPAASGGGDWGPLTQSKDDFPVDVPRSTDDLIIIAERAVRRYGGLLSTPLYSMQCARAGHAERIRQLIASRRPSGPRHATHGSVRPMPSMRRHLPPQSLSWINPIAPVGCEGSMGRG